LIFKGQTGARHKVTDRLRDQHLARRCESGYPGTDMLSFGMQNFERRLTADRKPRRPRARLLIEQAEALGEPPDDPLLLFSALDALFQTELVAFDGEVVRKDADACWRLANSMMP
jgi:hypothetical protein